MTKCDLMAASLSFGLRKLTINEVKSKYYISVTKQCYTTQQRPYPVLLVTEAYLISIPE